MSTDRVFNVLFLCTGDPAHAILADRAFGHAEGSASRRGDAA